MGYGIWEVAMDMGRDLSVCVAFVQKDTHEAFWPYANLHAINETNVTSDGMCSVVAATAVGRAIVHWEKYSLNIRPFKLKNIENCYLTNKEIKYYFSSSKNVYFKFLFWNTKCC